MAGTYQISAAPSLDSFQRAMSSIVNGRILFYPAERSIYFDYNGQRNVYGVITLKTELARTSLSSPLNGIYYIQETAKIWDYSDGKWTLVNSGSGDGGASAQQIIFDNYDNFPTTGNDTVIYVDDLKIYRWLNGRYQLMNTDGGGGTAAQQIVFDVYDNFPSVGESEVIYVDGTKIYRWIDNQYKLMNNEGGNPIWVDL